MQEEGLELGQQWLRRQGENPLDLPGDMGFVRSSTGALIFAYCRADEIEVTQGEHNQELYFQKCPSIKLLIKCHCR